MITGCQIHYELNLANALGENGVKVNFITGTSNMKFSHNKNVKLIDLRGDQNTYVSVFRKLLRILRYYYRLLKYIGITKNKLIHIQWYNFPIIEGVLLNTLYKIMGKKIIFTAHDILPHDKASIFNKLKYMIIYRNIDSIIVHTPKMKEELVNEFKVSSEKVYVVNHGIDKIDNSPSINKGEAREKLGLNKEEKVVLFFGNISPYKGLELLIQAIEKINDKNIKLLIAGNVSDKQYKEKILGLINGIKKHVSYNLTRINDAEIGTYFSACDVVILPYTNIYQSGVLFLAYFYGCPVIASKVGNFESDIIHGKTGLLFKTSDVNDLAYKLKEFYDDMYPDLDKIKEEIKNYANNKYSWSTISNVTQDLYQNLLE